MFVPNLFAADDPFGEAMSSIAEVLRWAHDHEGSMSGIEVDTLGSIYEALLIHDPDKAVFFGEE